jgi:pimeloyl-ACP methyl ester carboxylesterase
MTATTTTSGLIDVGATRLYHEVRGSGPALLLITGSTGDAGEWAQVAPALAEELTVVTYDRRGYSRSPRPVGWTATTAAEQAEDAAALLAALDLAPAVVVGHSAGASVACELVARHPELVRRAVCYEPPLLAVVPGGEQLVAGLRAVIEQAMAEGGPRRAMEAFMRGGAGDEVFERWSELADPSERDRVLGNGAVLTGIELPWVACFVPDLDAMRAGGVPLTVVSGEQTRDTWFGAAASWLAERTGAGWIELPGGHAGFVTHPEAFVALVQGCARGR